MKMSEDDRNPMRREYHHQKPKAPLLHQTNGGGANNPNNIDNDGLKTRDENAPMVEASKKSSVVPSSDNDSLSGKSRVKRAKLMYREIEELARERSGLSRRGLYYVCGMFVGLVLLVIVVVTLGACWPRVPHHQQYPVCTEAACLRASAQVREALDSSIQPCEDIYKWSCGGWLKGHPLPPDKSAWDQKYQLAKQESARIRELVTTLPLPVTTGTVNWKLKHFYEACLDVDNTNAEQARPLTSIISELGESTEYRRKYHLQEEFR